SGNYAQTLADLALAPVNSTSAFISPDLNINGIAKSGYIVNVGPGPVLLPSTLKANTCNASSAHAIPTYFAEAHPVTQGSTGQRSFGTDQRGTIFANNEGVVFTQVTVGTSTT